MTTTTLKKRIIRKIDEVQNEALLKAIYTILEESESDRDIPAKLTASQKKELDKRWNAYKSGKTQAYPADEMLKDFKSRLGK